MIFSHIGIFVNNLHKGRVEIKKIFPIKKASKEFHDPLLKVSVQFLYDKSNICYEIVAPNGKNNPVDNILKNKKNILNHIAYKTSNFDYTIKKYRNAGNLPIIEPTPSIAFNGVKVIFFLTKIGIIVEIIEKK